MTKEILAHRRQHHSLAGDPELCEKLTNHKPLREQASTVASDQVLVLASSMTGCDQKVNKPFPLYGALVRMLYHSDRKEARTESSISEGLNFEPCSYLSVPLPGK